LSMTSAPPPMSGAYIALVKTIFMGGPVIFH